MAAAGGRTVRAWWRAQEQLMEKGKKKKGGGECGDGLYGLGRGGRGREAAGFLADVREVGRESGERIRIESCPFSGAREGGKRRDVGGDVGRGVGRGVGAGGAGKAAVATAGWRWKKGPTGGPHLSVTRREEGGIGPAQEGGRAREEVGRRPNKR